MYDLYAMGGSWMLLELLVARVVIIHAPRRLATEEKAGPRLSIEVKWMALASCTFVRPTVNLPGHATWQLVGSIALFKLDSYTL